MEYFGATIIILCPSLSRSLQGLPSLLSS